MINKIVATTKQVYSHFTSDPLLRNSVFIMLSTFVLAVFGFVFWLVNARIFSPEQIGLATTLISVSGFLGSISSLGLTSAVLKYLPTSEEKNQKMNTVINLISIVTLFSCLIFILFLPTFSPKIAFFQSVTSFVSLFILFSILGTLNSILEYIFIAYRSSQFILIKNSILSISRLFLPFIFVSMGALGIFMGTGVATTLAVCFGFFILFSKFGYQFKAVISKDVLKKLGVFSMANYFTSNLQNIPYTLIPLLITNQLQTSDAAFYYMAMMVASFLFVIPQSQTQSLLTEGSYAGANLKKLTLKTIRYTVFLLTPAVLATLLLGRFVLLAFGKEYSDASFQLLQLLAISSYFVGINLIGNAVLNIQHRMKVLVGINFLRAVLIIVFIELLLPFKLLGVGLAWIIAQLLISILFVGIFRFSVKSGYNTITEQAST